MQRSLIIKKPKKKNITQTNDNQDSKLEDKQAKKQSADMLTLQNKVQQEEPIFFGMKDNIFIPLNSGLTFGQTKFWYKFPPID